MHLGLMDDRLWTDEWHWKMNVVSKRIIWKMDVATKIRGSPLKNENALKAAALCRVHQDPAFWRKLCL